MRTLQTWYFDFLQKFFAKTYQIAFSIANPMTIFAFPNYHWKLKRIQYSQLDRESHLEAPQGNQTPIYFSRKVVLFLLIWTMTRRIGLFFKSENCCNEPSTSGIVAPIKN